MLDIKINFTDVPLWSRPLPPSGKIENKIDEFENEPRKNF